MHYIAGDRVEAVPSHLTAVGFTMSVSLKTACSQTSKGTGASYAAPTQILKNSITDATGRT